jgi:hypothetical protein
MCPGRGQLRYSHPFPFGTMSSMNAGAVGNSDHPWEPSKLFFNKPLDVPHEKGIFRPASPVVFLPFFRWSRKAAASQL